MRMSKRGAVVVATTAMLLAVVTSSVAGEGWPREVDHPKARIVVYQPQFDAYDGWILSGSSAVSVTVAERT